MLNQIVKYIQLAFCAVIAFIVLLVMICLTSIFVACDHEDTIETITDPVVNTTWQGTDEHGVTITISFGNNLNGTINSSNNIDKPIRAFTYRVASNNLIYITYDPMTRIPYDFYLNEDGSGTYADTRLYRVQ